MPPKAGKEKAVEEEDDILQAVILADSFNSRFKPLSHAKPRVSTERQAFQGDCSDESNLCRLYYRYVI